MNEIDSCYTFPAIFTYRTKDVYIEFPDLNCSITCDDEYANFMAKDTLGQRLIIMKSGAFPIPQPSTLESFNLQDHQYVKMIKAWV